MVLDVHEPIEVSAVFIRGRLKPVSFIWNHRYYKISEVTGTYKYFIGTVKCYGFAVRANDEIYEVVFNTGDMSWCLEKVYSIE